MRKCALAENLHRDLVGMYQYEENSLLALDKVPRKTLNLHRKCHIQKTKNMALIQRQVGGKLCS